MGMSLLPCCCRVMFVAVLATSVLEGFYPDVESRVS